MFKFALTVALLATSSTAQLGNLLGSVTGLLSGATLFAGGASPIVTAPAGSFQGRDDARTQSSNYLGIRYASAPRFDHARLFSYPPGEVQDSSNYGPVCPQHSAASLFSPDSNPIGPLVGEIESIPLAAQLLQQSEDCLSINVQRPADQSLTNLPVVMWIHGGGFEVGGGSTLTSETSILPGVFYQGTNVVKRSIDDGRPIIWTSINYRLHHFGFSASREMAEAGVLNLGLEDQRVAMRWIQQNIASFGGDPSRVTIMGESAGSWSVTGHLVANNGNNEGLFSAAVGFSGGGVKVDGPERQQALFDDLALSAGCGGVTDVLSCLRAAPYSAIQSHAQGVNFFLSGYRSLASAWTLRPDGVFLTDAPDRLVERGVIAPVPIMYGDMQDEGTLFSLVNQLNVTSDESVKEYFKEVWWPNATPEQLDLLVQYYPSDPAAGSPFGTGARNDLTPNFKQIAAITGDYSFECQRRQLLTNHRAPKWNYLGTTSLPLGPLGGTPIGGLLDNLQLTDIPILGSFHASDVLLYWFGTIPAALSQNTQHMMGALVSFIATGDPNNHGMADMPFWPQWDPQGRGTIRFQEVGVDVIRDDYRSEAMEFLNSVGEFFRI